MATKDTMLTASEIKKALVKQIERYDEDLQAVSLVSLVAM